MVVAVIPAFAAVILVVREASPDAKFGFAGQGEYPHGWLRQFVEPFRALARSAGIGSGGPAQA